MSADPRGGSPAKVATSDRATARSFRFGLCNAGQKRGQGSLDFGLRRIVVKHPLAAPLNSDLGVEQGRILVHDRRRQLRDLGHNFGGVPNEADGHFKPPPGLLASEQLGRSRRREFG
jgi:hypothetical protein